MKKSLVAALAFTLFACGAAHASELYDNLGVTISDSSPVSAPPAASFSTGSSAFVFDDLKLLLWTSGVTGSTEVDLLADDSTSPGSLIETLGTIDDNDLSLSPAVVDLSSFAPVDLASNTRYWIALSTSDNSSARWEYAVDSSGIGVAGEFWYEPNFGTHPNGIDNDGPYQMAVIGTDVTPVPEPLTLALLGGGLAGLFFLRRRSRA